MALRWAVGLAYVAGILTVIVARWAWSRISARPPAPREVDVDEQRAIDEAEAAHRERAQRIRDVAEVRRVLAEARRSRGAED